jgi:N6-adenosine-specific RNA methylase IME4
VNSKSTCLVGYKCPIGNKAEYRTKVSNNILFAKSLEGMEKPAEIYEIADLMMPGAKKLEFGNDAQKGWLNLKHH